MNFVILINIILNEIKLLQLSKIKLLILMSLLTTCENTTHIPSSASGQELNLYFDSIRQDRDALRRFFWSMPKGGDIHHHAMGAVLAEDYLAVALENNYWVNTKTHELFRSEKTALASAKFDVTSIQELIRKDSGSADMIIDDWSMRNFKANNVSAKEHFFNTFMKFEEAMIGNEPYLLSKICEAANKENIQYIETMVAVPSIMEMVGRLAQGKTWNPTISVKDHLEEWYNYFESKDINHWVDYNVEVIDHWMEEANTHGITLKFQTVGLRILPNQAEIFSHLILAFRTAEASKHVVGVNFVAPEDHPLSLENYQTHMAMFRFLKAKFSEVNLSLHAGELTIGDADDHIDQAVRIAGAQRIGHGFDIRLERNSKEVLTLMKVKEIAVEINLETNKVILESDSSSHPVKDYLQAGVPVCISSDDPAILRSDLTNQYMILENYLPGITYTQIKEIIFNSLRYSFLSLNDKDRELSKLHEAFVIFESSLDLKKVKGLPPLHFNTKTWCLTFFRQALTFRLS